MNRFLLALCFLALVIGSCKNKKVISRTGEDEVEAADFIGFFQSVDLPFTIADTTLSKKLPDSSAIAYQLFTQFVPDSIFKKDFGKTKPKIYPLGKTK
ncbi:MAG: hypothetical protein J7497_11160, partial [Chitinophagaceae bacterium]|nr:hypothetical protein [Chitinophagaceae bacterium]